MIANESLPPISYYDPAVFEKEKNNVFQNSWMFAGFIHQVAKKNDFLSITIGNTPVVIQNFGNEIHALLNVCSHRKARLQTQAKGNRPLICPYHCWHFKNAGKLAAVPQNKSDFGLDDKDKEKLSLKQFSLESCGNFLFVRVSQYGPDLRDYLGPYFDILEEVSTDFTSPVQQGRYDWDCNWKLACETVLEVYHVAGVHPDTFAKFAKAECDIDFFDGHTTGNTPLQDSPKKWWAGARKLLNLKQSKRFEEYNHFFIYPNLAIGLTNGSLMSLQTYDPISPSKSRLNYQLHLMKGSNDKPTSDAAKAAIKQNFTQFNHTILEEDRTVAEACQSNMYTNNTCGIIGKCEDRIHHFHNAWRRDIQA